MTAHETLDREDRRWTFRVDRCPQHVVAGKSELTLDEARSGAEDCFHAMGGSIRKSPKLLKALYVDGLRVFRFRSCKGKIEVEFTCHALRARTLRKMAGRPVEIVPIGSVKPESDPTVDLYVPLVPLGMAAVVRKDV